MNVTIMPEVVIACPVSYWWWFVAGFVVGCVFLTAFLIYYSGFWSRGF